MRPNPPRSGLHAWFAAAAALLAIAGPIRATAPIPDEPAWVNHAVIYQVYPQTFQDSNGDGIGDIPGIISRLDYIKSLGVDAIWINPWFDSPFNDAGYDIRNYYKIAPRYGTNADARRLFIEAHKRGLKVLFDFVTSYTSIDNPWFVASTRQQPSRTWNWYIWTDNAWKLERGPRWVHGYGERNGNFLSNFFWNEPALNYGYDHPDPKKPWQLATDNPDVLALRAEMRRVMEFWMNMGADGFRADMAGSLVKNDRDGLTAKFWLGLRHELETRYPGAFTVAEWSDPEEALGPFDAMFYHWNRGFNDLYQKESWRILNGMSEGHSFFDREGKGDIMAFLTPYLKDYEATRSKGYICLPLGNHDLARLGNHRNADDLELIMVFGMTMPGVPFLYYGNEIGMRQLHNLPQIEGCYKPRAGARTPMQWTSGPDKGFSSAAPDKLYLPVDPDPHAPNVADEEHDPNSLLNRVRRLIALHKREPALAAYADFKPLYAVSHGYPFVYERSGGGETLVIALNPAAAPHQAEFEFTKPGRLVLIAGKPASLGRRKDRLHISMQGVSYAIYRLEPQTSSE